MDKKWILFGLILVLICGYVWYNYSRGIWQSVEIRPPHMKESLAFTLTDHGGGRHTEYYTAVYKDDSREANYYYLTGTTLGITQAVNYSDSEVKYSFMRQQFTRIFDKYICAGGNCNVLVEDGSSDSLGFYSGDTPDYEQDYVKIICYPNGTHYKYEKNAGTSNESSGNGCPGCGDLFGAHCPGWEAI